MAEGGDSVDSGKNALSSCRDNIPDVSSLNLGSDTVEPMLCKEHSQALNYFCTVTELCTSCRGISHKSCKTLIGKEQATNAIYSENDSGEIIKNITDLSERFQDCKNAAEDLKNNLLDKKRLSLDNVKQARKVIDDYLDKLEAKAVAETDRHFTEIIKAAEEQIYVCDASLSSLNSSLSNIEKINLEGNKEEQFIEINRATKQRAQYYNMLLDLRREMSEFDVKFEHNLKLSDVFDSLEKAFAKPSKVTKMFTDTKPVYTGEVDDGDDENAEEKQRSVVESMIPGTGRDNFFAPTGMHPSRTGLLWQTMGFAEPAAVRPPLQYARPTHYAQSAAQPGLVVRMPQVLPILRRAPPQAKAPGVAQEARAGYPTYPKPMPAQQPASQALVVPGQNPLTASMLADAPPQEQKQMLGERLFPPIQRMHPDLAGKITGMLLEIDNSELLHMLESAESLNAKVEECVAVLQAHAAKESAHQQAHAAMESSHQQAGVAVRKKKN